MRFIAKYAKASEVQITLQREDGRVNVCVHDNGVGFEPLTAIRSAHGLTGMRYRVAAQGGTFSVTSSPGQGTTIKASLPESAAADAPPTSSSIELAA